MSELDVSAPVAMPVRSFKEADLAEVCRIYVDAKRDELALEDSIIKVIPRRGRFSLRGVSRVRCHRLRAWTKRIRRYR